MLRFLRSIGTLLLAILLPFVLFMRKGRYFVGSAILFLASLAVCLVVVRAPGFDLPVDDAVINLVALFWVLTVIIALAASDESDRPAPAGTPPVTVPAKAASDFCKEQYEEVYSTYRYFGTMRARIAWTPAAVILAAGALLIREGGIEAGSVTTLFGLSVATLYIVAAIMFLVFVLIYLADIYFVREQLIMKEMCKICEWTWLEAARQPEGGLVVVSPYGELRKRALKTTAAFEIDPANVLLFVYLAAMSLIPVILLA